MNHNRIYCGALASLALITALSSGLLLFIAGASTVGPPGIKLPEWSLPWVAIINFAYTVAIVVTLCSRQFESESGRQLTRILNWALVPAFPGGTLGGIYGLWKVDKERVRERAA